MPSFSQSSCGWGIVIPILLMRKLRLTGTQRPSHRTDNGRSWSTCRPARRRFHCISSLSMVLGTAAPVSPGNLLEMQSLGSHPDLLNWKLEAWGPEVCVLTRPPGGSDAHSSARTTAVKDTETSLLNGHEFDWNLRKPWNDARGRVTKALHHGSARPLLFPHVEKPQKWTGSSQNEQTRWAGERNAQVSYLRP